MSNVLNHPIHTGCKKYPKIPWVFVGSGSLVKGIGFKHYMSSNHTWMFALHRTNKSKHTTESRIHVSASLLIECVCVRVSMAQIDWPQQGWLESTKWPDVSKRTIRWDQWPTKKNWLMTPLRRWSNCTLVNLHMVWLVFDWLPISSTKEKSWNLQCDFYVYERSFLDDHGILFFQIFSGSIRKTSRVQIVLFWVRKRGLDFRQWRRGIWQRAIWDHNP